VSRRDPLVRDTKQRILEAAVEVFGARGYAGASVDDVAVAAGVTKGAVYYYFKDKSDLARDLQANLWEQLTEQALAAYDPAQTTIENLTGCFGAFVTSIRAMTNARTFLWDSWFSLPLDPPGRAGHDAITLVRGILQGGIARGELAPFDLDALTGILVGALMEATLQILASDDIGPTMAVIGRFVESLAVEAAGADVATTSASVGGTPRHPTERNFNHG
jgi:AcrR family transcriptional regulator